MPMERLSLHVNGPHIHGLWLHYVFRWSVLQLSLLGLGLGLGLGFRALCIRGLCIRVRFRVNDRVSVMLHGESQLLLLGGEDSDW